jgi:hypothetical protein
VLDASLAAAASVTASSEQPGFEATLAVDPHSRSVHGERGVRPDLTEAGMHRWASQPGDSAPWLRLAWEEPVALKRITLVLDTGLHRYLTFSHLDSLVEKKMVWGPQPETLKEFRLVTVDVEGAMHEIAHVHGNYQRQLDFDVDLKGVAELRLDVLATNGLDHARVMQIRCE